MFGRVLGEAAAGMKVGGMKDGMKLNAIRPSHISPEYRHNPPAQR